MLATLVISLGFLLGPVSPPVADDATKLAETLLAQGAQWFDKKDAKSLAESYTEDATAIAFTKDEGSASPKVDIKRGRGEIQEFYASLFKDAATTHSKNTVEHARFQGNDFLVISGVFDPDLGNGFKVGFSQIRFKQGEKWLIVSMNLFLIKS
jgi:ketosteroid isomerase-like protein